MNKLNYDKNTVSFETIPVGGMFRYKQKVYMRIRNCFKMVGDNYSHNLEYKDGERYFNAFGLVVNLGSGEIESFEWNAEVDVMRIDKIEIEVE